MVQIAGKTPGWNKKENGKNQSNTARQWETDEQKEQEEQRKKEKSPLCLWGVFKLSPFEKKKSLKHLSSHKSLAQELKKVRKK